MNDPVNHPDHYTSHPSGFECIDIIDAMQVPIGNCVKYVWRHGLKSDEIQDLLKAHWYLQRQMCKHGPRIVVTAVEEKKLLRVAESHLRLAEQLTNISPLISKKNTELANFYLAIAAGKIYMAAFPLFELINAAREAERRAAKIRAQELEVETAMNKEYPDGVPYPTGVGEPLLNTANAGSADDGEVVPPVKLTQRNKTVNEFEGGGAS